MFEQLIESSSRKKQNRRRWLCFAGTAAVWVPGMMAAILAGVLAYDGRLSDQYGQPEKLVLLLPATPLVASAGPNTVSNPLPQAAQFVSPQVTPVGITTPSGPPVVAAIPFGGLGQGTGQAGNPFGDPNGTGAGGVPDAPPGGTAPPPEPAPQPAPKREEPTPAPPTKPHPSIVLQGTAVKKVEPAYPRIARETHTSGPVVVEVVVNEAGSVISARGLSGPPLLRSAAIEAARGWKWNPTRLNGVAVQVVGTITFNFVL